MTHFYHVWSVCSAGPKIALRFPHLLFCLLVCASALIMCTIMGASLSEPHTSVTSLRACVCMLACVDRPHTLILNMRFHLHVHNSNSNSKRSVESSSSSCSSTPMGLPSVSTTMELLSAKERLRLDQEGRATARLHARVCSYSHALIQYSRIFDAHRTRRNRLQQHSLWAPWVQVMSFFTRSWNSFIIYLLARARPHNV